MKTAEYDPVTDYKPNDDIREDLEITDISMKQSVEIA